MIKKYLNSDFSKKLIKLVLPIAMQQLMIALVSVTDAVMLGFLNQDALSAVSLAGQIQFVFSLFLFALMGGISIFAAQYWGINDRDSVEKILGIGLKWSVIISIPFTLGAFLFPSQLMMCFASQQVLIDGGAEYLRAVALSYLLLGISQPYLCVMKNCGMQTKSSVISSFSVVLNVFLNAILIFGLLGAPAMGIKGAAVATVISKIVELGWTLAVMFKRGNLKIRFKYVLRGDAVLKKDYWKYTLPILGNEIVWGMGITMYSVIMGNFGSDAVAANSIANIIKNLLICFCKGIAVASGVMIGIELGRGELETAKKYGTKLCRISLLSGIVSGALILCMIPFVPLFDSLTAVAQEYLKVMLVVSSYYVVGAAMNMTVIAGIFRSGGDSKFGFKCDAITLWCVTVPLGLISSFLLKLPVTTVYILINIDEIIKLPAVYRHYKKYLWIKNLTKKSVADEITQVKEADIQ